MAYMYERKIYINEDLTSKRAMLAYESRQLKKTKHINDCWTANGRVMIKDIQNCVHEISSANDLQQYKVGPT